MSNIKKIWLCPTLGGLPTSYTVSLTFEEQLIEFNIKLNEIIDVVNTISLDAINKLIDTAINNLKSYVDNQDNILYNYVDNNIEQTKIYADNEILKSQNYLISLLNEKYLYLLQYIDINNNLLKSEFQRKIDELNEKIDNIIIENILLLDPTTGKLSNIQTVINNIYNYLRYNAITALEFDSLGITAKQFDDLHITARDFDLSSKEILIKNKNYYMYNPFTGIYEPITSVINYLADFHKPNPITANDFDTLDLSCSTFDDKQITAYNFDLDGKSLLSA